MAKITVCDVCKIRHSKITETTRYMKVKNRPDLRIDLCKLHMLEFELKYPRVTPEYVQLVYEMTHNAKLTVEAAEALLRR